MFLAASGLCGWKLCSKNICLLSQIIVYDFDIIANYYNYKIIITNDIAFII